MEKKNVPETAEPCEGDSPATSPPERLFAGTGMQTLITCFPADSR